MKTLLFPTDFSGTATHAIKYGYSIAAQINANILLCNAVLSPAESPQVGLCVWPVEESDALLKDSTDKLKALATLIGHKIKNGSFKPNIKCIAEAGTVYIAFLEEVKLKKWLATYPFLYWYFRQQPNLSDNTEQ